MNVRLIVGALIAAAVIVVAIVVLTGGEDGEDVDAAAAPGGAVAAGQVIEDTDRYLDRTLEIRGDVTLAGEETLSLGEDDLVVVPRRGDMIPELEIGDRVQVRGEVRRLDRLEMDPLTDADLDNAPGVGSLEEGTPVVLASSIALLEGRGGGVIADAPPGGPDPELENTPEASVPEGEALTLDGIRYRVMLFRQLNPRTAPDDAVYDGGLPGEGASVWAAFVEACNTTTSSREPTEDIVLVDAFGERFEPVGGVADAFAYSSEPLEPRDCRPPKEGATQFDGDVLAFLLPNEATSERPLMLELRDGDKVRRVALDV